MKTIELTQNQMTLVDDVDYEYLNQFKWNASWYHKGYRAVRTSKVNGKKKTIRMHRVIAKRMGIDSMVDHKDRNPLNNCRSNLRAATNSQNLHNRGPQSNSLTSIKGVCFHKQTSKYHAQITVEGKKTSSWIF